MASRRAEAELARRRTARRVGAVGFASAVALPLILAVCIGCPVLAIQGENDEYGTMAQLDEIARRVKRAELLKLPKCGHSPFRDQPGPVLEAVGRFVEEAG